MFEGRKILWVAGGRDFTDRLRARSEIEQAVLLGGFEVLMTGAARGADLTAESVSRQLQMPYVGIPAEWSRYGQAAGPIRNRVIARMEPDALLALPGGSGTADARLAAEEYRIAIFRGPAPTEEEPS